MTTIERNPMNRTDREDLTQQRDAIKVCRAYLSAALYDLAAHATTAYRAYGRKGRVSPSCLDDVYTRIAAVRRAEEALDLAELDLRTAAGEDA